MRRALAWIAKWESPAGRPSDLLGAADDVVGTGSLSFEEEVGLADGVGLAVDLLAVQVRGDLLAMLFGQLRERVFRHG